MGKGDKKTRKGKIAMGSYGKTRPHHVKPKPAEPAEKKVKPAEAEKTSKVKKPSA
jgi:30S ribosomal protein S31